MIGLNWLSELVSLTSSAASDVYLRAKADHQRICNRVRGIGRRGHPLFFNYAVPHRLVAPVDLGPIEKYSKNASDFCAAARQLLGPNGVCKRQMLEAN